MNIPSVQLHSIFKEKIMKKMAKGLLAFILAASMAIPVFAGGGQSRAGGGGG
jgi:hypothetical protein